MAGATANSSTLTAPAIISAAALQTSIRVEPLTCSIGAELSNVNLGVASRDPALRSEINSLLLQYRVLFFRDQDITRAEHVAFASHFGELEDHPVAGSDPDHPGLVQIYRGGKAKDDHYENAWHCDATWREKPPMGCVLRCIETPEVGGDMLWSNMVDAYSRLPEHIKGQIASLRARHSIEATFGAAMLSNRGSSSRLNFRMLSTRSCAPTPRRRKRSSTSTRSRHTSQISTPQKTCATAKTMLRAARCFSTI